MKRFITVFVALIFVFSIVAVAFADDSTTAPSTQPNVSSDNTAKPGEIGKRQLNQQKRIKQGIKSGQLTKGEAKNLEGNEKMLQKEKKDMKAQNGGKLSKGDKKLLNKQLNQQSKKIYNKKHNDVKEPNAK
jgi:hypothetical protein